MTDPVIIQLIADYGVGDPAFAEVIQKLTYLDRHIRVSPISVPKFSTVATGFWIAQLSSVNAFPGLIIYSNTAPRIAITEKNHDILGGKLAYTKLENGTIIIAVNVGYCFSFVKKRMKNFHVVNVANAGSQFRSRDYYPDAVLGVVRGETKYIGEEIPIDTIMDIPSNLIGFVDGYGNLKTTMQESQCPYKVGTRVRISCNNYMLEGVVGDETYHVRDGEISFAPGSTGDGDRYMEIWVRGLSAWETFGKPRVEEEFRVEEVK